MDEIKIGAEQEIYLAPETEKIENAEEIAKISLDVEKNPFIIGCDANEKENIITELEKLGCDEIKQLDFANCIAVSMSMAQLKAIKTLVGVEKVEKDCDYKCLINGVSESEYSSYLAGVNPQLNNKKEVKLAVFDTGVTNVSVDGSVNFINDVSTDENGHGTQMAGIISAVVANMENKVASPSIYSVVITDHRGFAKTSTIMQALDWAINNGIKIVCSNTGSFSFKVDYGRDDHGNSMDNATEIVGVYYQDKSVNGYLHSYGDVDYYTFVPARNCVMEIYTEGDTNTYGQLYCASGGLLDSDNNSNGNGNFKITAHLEGMKRYYIAVSHNSSTGYGDYTLRFKFVKDYCDQLVDEQYRVMFWYADNQDEYPEMGNSITRSKVFVSNRAKAEFEDRIILDEYNQKTGLRAVLDNGSFQDVFNYLLDYLISSIPLIGSSLSFASNVGSIMYDFMSSLDLIFYREKKHAIENTNQYIIGEHYWFTDYPNGMATGSYNTYSIGSGAYYGKEYQRGTFIETYIKN